MRIQLNGEPRDLPGPVTVRALLDSLGLDARLVAVELDRVVITSARFRFQPDDPVLQSLIY